MFGFGIPIAVGGASTPAAATGNTFNPSDATNAVLSNSNTTFANNGSTGWVRSLTSHATGLYYAEFSWDGGGATPYLSFGVAVDTGTPLLASGYVGQGTDSVGFIKQAYTVFGDAFVDTALGSTVGHVFAMAVNLTTKRAWFRNVTTASSWFGSATGDPAAGTNGLNFSASSVTDWRVMAVAATGQTAALTVNLGGSAFVGTPPSGFSAWG